MKEESKKQLIEFFSKYPLKKYKKGQIVGESNENFKGVYFVKSGYLRVYDIRAGEKESGIQLSNPWFYLSLIGAKTGLKNRHFIETMSPVEAWMAPTEDFKNFLKNNPKLDEEINRLLMENFLDLTTFISQLISGNAYLKVAGLIYSLSREYGVTKGKEVSIKVKITHKQIAALTGLTRETVTLQMLKLEKNQVIDNDKRQIVVKNIDELKKLLERE